jgi:hypothetical protein
MNLLPAYGIATVIPLPFSSVKLKLIVDWRNSKAYSKNLRGNISCSLYSLASMSDKEHTRSGETCSYKPFSQNLCSHVY